MDIDQGEARKAELQRPADHEPFRRQSRAASLNSRFYWVLQGSAGFYAGILLGSFDDGHARRLEAANLVN